MIFNTFSSRLTYKVTTTGSITDSISFKVCGCVTVYVECEGTATGHSGTGVCGCNPTRMCMQQSQCADAYARVHRRGKEMFDSPAEFLLFHPNYGHEQPAEIWLGWDQTHQVLPLSCEIYVHLTVLVSSTVPSWIWEVYYATWPSSEACKIILYSVILCNPMRLFNPPFEYSHARQMGNWVFFAIWYLNGVVSYHTLLVKKLDLNG